jgi:hypothetical protein
MQQTYSVWKIMHLINDMHANGYITGWEERALWVASWMKATEPFFEDVANTRILSNLTSSAFLGTETKGWNQVQQCNDVKKASFDGVLHDLSKW